MSKQLVVAYIGNFEPPHSTENHVARALRWHGHRVDEIQENRADSYRQVTDNIDDYHLVLWTRTGWDWAHIFRVRDGDRLAHRQQIDMLETAAAARVATVGFHLDRWWDLGREHQLDEPFFKCQVVYTADGGNQDRFAGRGINHRPILPGVSMFECESGVKRSEYVSPLTFVGSWQGGYHAEHRHRHELVRWLYDRGDCQFWPKVNQPAVRGSGLRDLYTSAFLLVGDSCFAGSDKSTGYVSDRIPETLGRGGLLIHPRVPGVTDRADGFLDGEHLLCWDAYNWTELEAQINWVFANPDAARRIAFNGRRHVIANHTYEVRVAQIVDQLEEEGELK